MLPIPVLLKTDSDMPRPDDPEYYLVAQDGVFLCRNHRFFSTDVPVKRPIRSLVKHQARCHVHYPKVGRTTLSYIVGFFNRVYEKHSSEAVVLLFWDLKDKRYRICVPEQKAKVWESYNGCRSPKSVAYKMPPQSMSHMLLVGDVHSHGNLGAYSSCTDVDDEIYRDGVHVVIGHIKEEPPEFHLEMAIDQRRFKMRFEQFFEGYDQRRLAIPQEWMDKVSITIDRPWGAKWLLHNKH